MFELIEGPLCGAMVDNKETELRIVIKLPSNKSRIAVYRFAVHAYYYEGSFELQKAPKAKSNSVIIKNAVFSKMSTPPKSSKDTWTWQQWFLWQLS